jgi:hypothetical protein
MLAIATGFAENGLQSPRIGFSFSLQLSSDEDALLRRCERVNATRFVETQSEFEVGDLLPGGNICIV